MTMAKPMHYFDKKPVLILGKNGKWIILSSLMDISNQLGIYAKKHLFKYPIVDIILIDPSKFRLHMRKSTIQDYLRINTLESLLIKFIDVLTQKRKHGFWISSVSGPYIFSLLFD